jgi:hypothetical protein
MLIEKQFHFERCDGSVLSPRVLECFDEQNVVFTWDSSILLAAYLMTLEQVNSVYLAICTHVMHNRW